jgi:parallel beta-helix repeat protein
MMKRTYLSTTFIFLFLTKLCVQGQVKEYFISCNPADFNYIYANYWEDIYIPVTITYNDTTWTDTKMRIRGDGSRQFPKKSLKVKFDNVPFSNGRYELNFNAEWEDKSYMRAFVSSRVFKNAGQRCFDTDYARLYLNGEFLGLYCYVENVDEQFLEANNYDPNGNLYKAAVDGACLSIYDDIVTFWAQETVGGNKEDLAAFIDQINNVSDADYLEFCQETMDYNQMVNIIACNMVLSNHSTYYHNYFMFHDVNGNNKWEMMPWDLDKTLSVYAWKNYTNSSAPWVPDNPFLERALLNNVIFLDIRNRVQEITSEVFSSQTFWPMMDSLVTLLQPSILQDTTDDIANVQEWLDQVNAEKNYIANWPSQLQWQFEHIPSTFVAQRTPGAHEPDITFSWTPSIDPDGNPVYYRFILTTGMQFEPELTTVYDSITSTEFTLNNLPEDDYFWKVATKKGDHEVEAFDSKNPLTIAVPQFLPCVIQNDMILTSDSSPYYINCDVEVLENATLNIQSGVELIFTDSCSIRVYGKIKAEGTKSSPVVFKPADNLPYWDTLVIKNAISPCIFNNVQMINGRLVSYDTDIILNNFYQFNSKHLIWTDGLFDSWGGNIEITNSTFISNNTGEGLIICNPQSAIVEGSYFYQVPDAVEYLYIQGGSVKNNIIIDPHDDGIDLDYAQETIISGNKIFGASDNGITLDSCQNILVENNLLMGCIHGINFKNNANGTIKNNTLYGNEIGIHLYEKYAGSGGGHVNIVNSILSNSLDQVISADQYSSYTVDYSLCDSEIFNGTGNILDDPDFISVADSNFQLQSGSSCINSGDPASQKDPDGTVSDMGAFYYNFGLYNVIFNEVNYKSETAFDTEDWVELYNGGETEADISGWIFRDEDDNHIFEIPFGTVIQPEGYIVLCSDLLLFKEQHSDIENVLGSFPFGLSSFGEMIRLNNHIGILVDSLVYGVDDPWPVEPNGQGSTLELKNPLLDNALPENWCASANHGSPGHKNSCYENAIIEPNEPENTISIYPNPATSYIYFYLADTSKTIEYLEIFDRQGRLVLKMDEVNNNFIDLRENIMHEGIYFISALTKGDIRFTGKFVIIKPK